MIRALRLLLCAGLALALCAGLTPGVRGQDQPPAPAQPPAGQPPAGQPPADQQPGPRPGATPAASARPRPKAPASPDPFRAEERRGRLDELELPTIEVRGLIEIEGRPPAALIRVGTYSHVAVKGDSLSLSAKLLGGRGPSEQRVELEVLSVSKAGLRLRHRESNKELLYR